MNMIDYPNIFTIGPNKVKERKDMDVNEHERLSQHVYNRPKSK
jgi:hypothetical protein